jgi:HAD superfamily phosphatase (TIGR01668 family)
VSNWRSGTFDRTRLHPIYHPFAPAHSADSLQSIDLQVLWDAGKRLLLLDVDNTLVQWKGENFSEPVLAWVQKAKAMGFEICIISNTRRVQRLERLRQLLQVETVRGRFKPSRAMFRLALAKFKRKKSEAIMIGDQMMTDVLGANRAGIDAIWVRKMDAKEFGPTRINRFVEGLLTGPIYRSLVAPVDESPDAPEVEREKPVAEKTIVHQVVKFAIVGGTSFVVDYVVRFLLLFGIHVGGEDLGTVFGRWLMQTAPNLFAFASGPHKAAFPFAAAIAALVAMLNSFTFNRMWTFEIRGREERAAQLRRFYAVSLVGAALNTGFGTLFNALIAGDPKASVTIATILAALITAVWNFIGQRVFAFRVAKR